MTKPTLSDAISEARTTANPDVIEIITLEFKHPDMSASLRVASGLNDVVAKLEDGTTQSFAAVPFTFKQPSQGTSPTPEAVIEVSNTNGILTEILDDIMQSFVPIKVVCRLYTNITLNVGPGLTPPPTYQIVSASGLSVIKLTLRPIDLTKMNFPKELYREQ